MRKARSSRQARTVFQSSCHQLLLPIAISPGLGQGDLNQGWTGAVGSPSVAGSVASCTLMIVLQDCGGIGRPGRGPRPLTRRTGVHTVFGSEAGAAPLRRRREKTRTARAM